MDGKTQSCHRMRRWKDVQQVWESGNSVSCASAAEGWRLPPVRGSLARILFESMLSCVEWLYSTHTHTQGWDLLRFHTGNKSKALNYRPGKQKLSQELIAQRRSSFLFDFPSLPPPVLSVTPFFLCPDSLRGVLVSTSHNLFYLLWTLRRYLSVNYLVDSEISVRALRLYFGRHTHEAVIGGSTVVSDEIHWKLSPLKMMRGTALRAVAAAWSGNRQARVCGSVSNMDAVLNQAS